jgi:hypothetical protein
METTSLPGKIQVTKDVWDISKTTYSFDARGEMLIKGKGSMPTFFLNPSNMVSRNREVMKDMTTKPFGLENTLASLAESVEVSSYKGEDDFSEDHEEEDDRNGETV